MNNKGKIENQEDIYKFILHEQWSIILDVLYKEKEKIKNDVMLNFAAKTFETEFLNKVSSYDISNNDITENLGTLYLLHHGNFYKLTLENYKLLIVEIVKRKSLEEAFKYAQEFPDNEICKTVIDKYNIEKMKNDGFKQNISNQIPLNWIEIYNRIFELINIPEDTATYFSGPRFIDTVRQFETYFPTYSQYINQRNIEGKSTTRKIFYYDILLSLNDESRIKVVNRILEILKPFQEEKVLQIENILGGKFELLKEKKTISSVETENKPVIFISYSWDSEEHKEWVLNLANKLCDDGIDVILDRYHLRP